jgi:diadenosine tetraphosphate (Ap4A) HIT family hydrolase
MATLYTKIIDGDIPGRFVWADDECVAFLTIEPITPGHTLVVPRAEIEQWTAADDATLAHLMSVARRIGEAQQAEWDAPRAGVLVEGFLVPHLHIHVWPARSPADFEVHHVDRDPGEAALDDAAERIRARLRAAGHDAFVPGPGPLGQA